ncbi:MAG: hypothetical protein EZS28_025694 [Streblomastix strix]|uniref:Uncharacterized protein n=1 Tax=Streblomastix strix TaxID=222440 RepID=A0A5J4V8G5_9EUKA|nr:MAG: hypothetical protein EZS28_025694 [Streblomastix strix]
MATKRPRTSQINSELENDRNRNNASRKILVVKFSLNTGQRKENQSSLLEEEGQRDCVWNIKNILASSADSENVEEWASLIPENQNVKQLEDFVEARSDIDLQREIEKKENELVLQVHVLLEECMKIRQNNDEDNSMMDEISRTITQNLNADHSNEQTTNGAVTSFMKQDGFTVVF